MLLPLQTIEVKTFLLDLQQKICSMLEAEDKKQFKTDNWTHHQGGGGITRVLTGETFEKAAVNFSHVVGQSLPKAATLQRPDLADCPFHALGVSSVIHPLNPYVPTTHFNVRHIVVEKKQGAPSWWFGGGFDLTPYYGFTEDCIYWHAMAQSACKPFGPEVYPKFKKWCDEYFYLKHRQEPRGIGGIFFDDLHEWGMASCFEFIKAVGEHFIQAYQPIVARRKNQQFGQEQRQFQLYRRGRYVEFNLLYDRGTLFGLQSGGRTESILVSLPPEVRWEYDWTPAPHSREAKLYTDFLPVKEWIAS